MSGSCKSAALGALGTMRTRAWLYRSTSHQRRSLQSSPGFPSPSNNNDRTSRYSSRRIRLPAPPTSATPVHQHVRSAAAEANRQRKITFVDKHGSKHVSWGSDGDSLLRLAQASPLAVEGACGGLCACSTCHVVVENEEMFAKMKTPSEDENDMLDLASGLTDTSRLSCQVTINKHLNGLVVRI